MKLLEMVELEERVGRFWHRLVGQQSSWQRFPEAAVQLASLQTQLSVFFRGLGGDPGLSLVSAGQRISKHRLTWKQRIGMDDERLAMASRDELSLSLPETIDCFPDKSLNADIYFWLAAYFTALEPPVVSVSSPVVADFDFIGRARLASRRVLTSYPGLRPRYENLSVALLKLRPARPLQGAEKIVEEAVLEALRDPFSEFIPQGQVGRMGGYRPFLPIPLWGEILSRDAAEEQADEGEPHGGPQKKGGDDERKRYRARRESSQEANRKDGLILNRFEKILSFAEMMALNRATDDADEDEAKKAADDLEHISLGTHWKKPASKLRLDLDLPPGRADDGKLQGGFLYPEWDSRLNAYRSDYCKVTTGVAPEHGEDWQVDDTLRLRVRRIRRQFEALLSRPQLLKAQQDGSDLDTDALVRSACELKACGYSSEHVYIQHRKQERDLSVLVLVDVSLSTDAWIENRRVLDVEKEALTVFSHALAACGDSFSIQTFTSKRRANVRLETIKAFDEKFGDQAVARIGAMKPGYYTRIGAAVRHCAKLLNERPNRHRLLLIITDGKPNDIDHYEGRYALDDTRKSIQEARRLGLKVFGVTVDRKAQDYFPYLFGRGCFAIVSHLNQLTASLPRLYRHLAVA
jgi:nitric oxide reductase NorD protein